MNWANLAYQAFIDLCNTFGVSPDHVLQAEYPVRISYDGQIPCGKLRKLTAERWDEWQKQLENGLELLAETLNGNLILQLDSNVNSTEALEDFQEGSKDVPDDHLLKTTIVLNKAGLASRHIDPKLLSFVKLFFASTNFKTILSKPIVQIQEYLFNDSDGESRDAAIIILLDAKGYWEGPCLVVCGADQTAKLSGYQPPTNELTNTIIRFKKCRKDYIYWTGLDTKLTPLHFKTGKITGQVEQSLAEALTRVNVALSLAYIADAVEVEETRFLCSFLGIARSDIECDLSDSSQTIKKNYADRMAEWAYEEAERISDRLTVLRQTIALRLGSDRKSNLINFVNESEILWRVSIAAYRDRFQENIKLQFQRRKEYTEFVQETVASFGDQIGNITKNLTTTALTALGVVIGLFITDFSVKNLSNELIVKLAKAYLIYLLALPLFYSGANLIFDYIINLSEYRKRKRRFIRELSKEEVEEITGSQIRWRHIQFWCFFVLSIAVYFGIAWVIWFRPEWIINLLGGRVISTP